MQNMSSELVCVSSDQHRQQITMQSNTKIMCQYAKYAKYAEYAEYA